MSQYFSCSPQSIQDKSQFNYLKHSDHRMPIYIYIPTQKNTVFSVKISFYLECYFLNFSISPLTKDTM